MESHTDYNPLDSLFQQKEQNPPQTNDNNFLNTSFDFTSFPDLVELFPADNISNAANTSYTETNDNYFGESNTENLFNESWNVLNAVPSVQLAPDNVPVPTEIKKEIKVETIDIKAIKMEENLSPSMPQSPARKKLKKSKKEMTKEELEEKKRQQTEKRILKNRRTADVSRRRKKAKKVTLEESLKQLSEDQKVLEKQTIEMSAENRVLKSEYLALLSLIQNTPKLSKLFDKITTLSVSQPEKLVMADTASVASVYLVNMLYSLHQTWNMMKNIPTEQKMPVYPLPGISTN